MTITRRNAIKNCLVFAIGSVLVPACVQESKPSIPLKNISLSDQQEKLIIELCETIIPATDTPGAKDTYTHLFVLKMLDDMYAKKDQRRFVKGLKEFDELCKNRFNKPFIETASPERDQLVQYVIDHKEGSEDLDAFYSIMKKLTVQGFVTSKYYLTTVQVYQLVPGKFQGCIPVESLNKKAGSI